MRGSEAEVAQMPDVVIWRHDGVPSRNHGTIHMGCVVEGTSAVLDDICVPEVCIGDEPGRHFLVCFSKSFVF